MTKSTQIGPAGHKRIRAAIESVIPKDWLEALAGGGTIEFRSDAAGLDLKIGPKKPKRRKAVERA